MRRFIPKSFFGQLVLSTVLVQMLLLLLFVYYIIVSMRTGAVGRSEQRIGQQLDRIASALSVPLANGDGAGMRQVLELARVAPTIDVARLTDLRGQTLEVTENGRGSSLDAQESTMVADVAGSAAEPGANGQRIFKLKNGQLEAVAPVLKDGRPMALLWLEPSHTVSTNTLNLMLRICLTYGGFALLANLLPIFLIVRTMTRPLRVLGDATHRLMENPDLKAGFPLPVTTMNEAGQLTSSFNSMVEELEERRHGLLETLALLDSMLGNAPIGFAFFDDELGYVRVNEFLANAHGLPVYEHVGRRATEFYPDELSKLKEGYIAKVFATGEAIRNVELSGEMTYAPGVERSWLMHFYPVRTGGGPQIRWVGVIVVEITERLQAEEALRKTEKLAAAGRLAASIAHEINNPLESVTNLLYLLGTHDGMDGAAVEYVATAQAELARVAEITQQTLRFYRQSTSAGPSNLVEVMDSLLTLYRSRLAASHVTVERRFRGEPQVWGFGGELRQLFANLMGNAVDAMPNGGALVLSLRRSCGRRSDGVWCGGVRASVTDTGMGMSEATRRRIFEAFFTTKQATGTGLGLWISAEIIAKHGGTVRVKSRQGTNGGTSFMMFFPDRAEGVDEAEVETVAVESVVG
jgi:signal transduction histidine kinase/HAMP domain-containing protein